MMRFGAPTIGIAIFASACGGVGLCSNDELVEALASAGDGDTVHLGNCRVAGSFVVPPGVIFEGVGRAESAIMAQQGSAGVVLTPGSSPTCVRSMTIESVGPVALLSRGAGSICIEQVDVRAAIGVGVGIEDVGAVVMHEVQMFGPVTPQNATAIAQQSLTSTQTATHGLVMIRVPSAALDRVTSTGFAAYGALVISSTATWNAGGASGNMGIGLLGVRGSLVLQQLELSNTLSGFQLEPAYGGAFIYGARITTNGLRASSSQGFGLFHFGGFATHTDVDVRDNAREGIWLQSVPSLSLSGVISNNVIAGLVALDSTNIDIHDATIERTITAIKTRVHLLPAEIGDGIQLVRTPMSVQITNVALLDNGRVGMLIDPEGFALSGLAISSVMVSGGPAALGAIGQGTTFPNGWDSGVMRGPSVLVNDAAFQGTLETVALTGPCDYPNPGRALTSGIMGLTGL